MAIREEFLNELRERTDIEALVSGYVDLKRAGRLCRGLCPFHSEKSPSFTVYPDTQSYYCFGCGKGGDVITFIREIENLDYIESVKLLADRAGLNMPDDNYDDTLSKKRQRMLKINKDAARFFYTYMMSEAGRDGLSYWLGRGLQMSTIKHFGLGYAPNDWRVLRDHMHTLGYSDVELLEADLVRKSVKDGRTSYYDNFRNRVMTPIIDLRGNVIGFGGRVLDDSKPKYVNTSDTLVYKKSLAVFALNFAKSSGKNSLILCEGYMDVIALHQSGFTNAVAGLGTALTDEQVRLISRYADEVILSYDSDEAGQKALNRAMEKFGATDISIRALRLSGGKDPDEIIKKFGAERFRSIVEGAANEVEYKLQNARNGLDLDSDDGRVNYLRRAVPILASINSAIERDIYAGRLSEDLSVSKDAIVLQVKDALKRQNRESKRVDFSALRTNFDAYRDKSSRDATAGIKVRKAEDALLSSLFNNPDFLSKTEELLKPEDLTDEFYVHLYTVLRDRIRAGESIDLIYLSSEFSPEEMGRIVKLQNGEAVISNTWNEVNDCISVILSEKDKQDRKDPASLSDEEFLRLFQNKDI